MADYQGSLYLYLQIPFEHDGGLLGLCNDSQCLSFRYEGKMPSEGLGTIFLTHLLCFCAHAAPFRRSCAHAAPLDNNSNITLINPQVSTSALNPQR